MMYSENIASSPGSVSQEREATGAFMQLAKGLAITIFIVGHVTKEGVVAGPRDFGQDTGRKAQFICFLDPLVCHADRAHFPA